MNNTGPGNGINISSGIANFDYNWYGNNTPDPIPGAVMDNYYMARLTANTTTDNISNTTSGAVFHMLPGSVTLGYDLVLNTTNTSINVTNLPAFDAVHRVDGGIYTRGLGLLHSLVSLLSVSADARTPFSNTSTLSSFGDNATLNTTVDNENMNITAIAVKSDSAVGILVNSSFISSSDSLMVLLI